MGVGEQAVAFAGGEGLHQKSLHPSGLGEQIAFALQAVADFARRRFQCDVEDAVGNGLGFAEGIRPSRPARGC